MIIECNVILFTWKIIKTNYSSRIIIAEESSGGNYAMMPQINGRQKKMLEGIKKILGEMKIEIINFVENYYENSNVWNVENMEMHRSLS